MKPAVSGALNFGRIAKPLRGGGGTASGVAPASPGFAGTSAASPLGRVQSEEGRYVHPPNLLQMNNNINVRPCKPLVHLVSPWYHTCTFF